MYAGDCLQDVNQMRSIFIKYKEEWDNLCLELSKESLYRGMLIGIAVGTIISMFIIGVGVTIQVFIVDTITWMIMFLYLGTFSYISAGLYELDNTR